MRKSQTIVIAIALMLSALGANVFAVETQAAPSGVVNINSADIAQLSLLPRVGEKAAQRVVDYRTQHGAFKKASDLMQVKGFGAKTYELVSAYVTIEGKTTLSSKVHGPRKPRAKKPTTTASN